MASYLSALAAKRKWRDRRWRIDGSLMTDAVEKVSAKKLWNWNLNDGIPATRFLNQDCVVLCDLESMLLRASLKILFQRHRPKADIEGTEIPQCSGESVVSSSIA